MGLRIEGRSVVMTVDWSTLQDLSFALRLELGVKGRKVRSLIKWSRI